jgi:DNA replication protein DnaC
VFPIEIANQIRELQSLRFLDEGRNVILVGNPGVGKTHTAIGLGLAANMKMKNVLYITIPNLITELKESMTLNQLTNYKKRFITYDLVILDELGYISFDKQGSELLFNLLSMRNETKSIIITTNLSFNRWEEIFIDPTLTAAMVDRLAHKATVINIKGDSYRIKETKEWLGVKN